MMKKFRILGILAIIAIIVNFIGGLEEGCKSFKKGLEQGTNRAQGMYEPEHNIPRNAISVKLNVEPLPGMTTDSLSNSTVKHSVPYTVCQIETYAKPSIWYIILMILIMPVFLLFFIGFYSLIRLLISISRREVFTPHNVLRLRWYAYTSAGLKLLIAIEEWFTGNAAMSQISLPGYEISSHEGFSPDWVTLIIPILFAEIFAIGVKMKEEQDLTI